MLLTGASTRYLFFTGKGGVGKTTIASRVAMELSATGARTLIVSTDPASNLGDVFQMVVTDAPTPVPDVSALWIMNIDPEAAAHTYREGVVGPYRGVLPDAAVRSMEEQMSGACTVEIAAFNEFTALLSDDTLAERFDHVVFDTAPTGHTLRLLTLPSAWSGYVETSAHGASCLGPLAGLERHQEAYRETVRALSDPIRTTVILVARPDQSALREAARASAELATLGVSNQRLVINGVMDADDEHDDVARAVIARQTVALATMPVALQGLERLDVPLVGGDLVGVAQLRAFGLPNTPAITPAIMPAITPAVADSAPSAPFAAFDALVDEIAHDGHGVVMTMGKGGVGKTTIAARLALALARRGHRVHLTTTDPAAHVSEAVEDATGDALGARPSTLSISRIDPAAESARYTADVLAAAGPITDDERALLEEDLRSPCTEEIAVFRAFAQVVDGAANGFVVLDTAPTGHTLLLLDAAESYHREVQRSTGQVPEAVRALLPRLRDPRFTKMLLVTLAESTPVHEAERLQADLRRAGIEPYGWVVNASLAASGTRHSLLAARAALEAPHLHRVAHALSRRRWLVPWSNTRQSEPLGVPSAAPGFPSVP
jgi:arsenite-transporting ATPase